MVIRSDKMGQSWLLPPSVSDLIPVDHICYLVIAIVNSIDVSEIEEKYRFKPGNPAYPRRMLLRLLVQAAIDGVWSSRKIDKLAHENVVYMYLAGNEKPDFRTLYKFRSENKELIEATFEKTVTFAKALGILNLGHLSTDGTKMKANASNDYTLSKAEIEAIREIIEHGIAIDEEEDKLYGDKRGDELPPELNAQQKIREKLKEIEQASNRKLKSAAKKIIEQHALGDELQKEQIIEKLDKAEEELNKSGQSAVSITDPEARFMKNKKERIELSYNSQITVDHDSGIIVANDVTQDCTDHAQLEPQVNSTMENVEGLPEGAKMCFDTDEEKDQFLCPSGEILSRKGGYEYKGKQVYAYYGANCGECPFRSECAGEGKIRTITSDGYEGERRI